MAKKVRERALDTRAAREKLKVSGKPYYRALGPELHLGYRKGKDARRWVARLYLGGGQYRVENIGHADDVADADGVRILDYWQAQEKARGLQGERTTASGGGKYTVRHAIADYLDSLDGRPAQRKTELRLAAYVPAELAAKELDQLKADDLDKWLRAMTKLPPLARTSEDAEQRNYRKVDMRDPEVIRQRKSSANRVMNQLRAALNLAFKHGKTNSDAAWKRVSAFRDADAARVHYLKLAECQRLINACDPEFRSLVRAALMTGARYQELARLKVEDFNPDAGTVQIRLSKSGKPRHVVLTDEARAFFGSLPAGRSGSEILLGRAWRDGVQARRMKHACERAKINPPIGFHGLRHTWASLSVMNGLPLLVVAKNLGHSDTRMVEKHYGHLAPSYIADAIRAHAPCFGTPEGKVKAIR
jgi:integrase